MTEPIQNIEENTGFLKDLRRLFKAWFTGGYRVIPWRSLFLLAYIISPIDFIPEALFPILIGEIDDAAVFVLLIRSLMKDVEKFREWESGQRITNLIS